MKRTILLAALALVFSGTAVAADGPAYNYVDAGYTKVADLSDGWGVRGGLKFGDSNFYGKASYSRQKVDNWDVNYNLADVSLGYAHAFTPLTHLNAELGYQRISAEGESADGYKAGLGVRHAFSPRFEGLLRANHYFGGDLEDGDTTGTIGGAFYFTQALGGVAEVEFGDGGETYMVGLRYAF